MATPTKPKKAATLDFASRAAKLIEERHGEDVHLLDLRGLSSITDYFLIATGTSDRQLRSVCDEIEALGKPIGHTVWKVAGKDSGDWIVMDFVDVVIHLFSRDLRDFYDLELIWGEAPKVQWR